MNIHKKGARLEKIVPEDLKSAVDLLMNEVNETGFTENLEVKYGRYEFSNYPKPALYASMAEIRVKPNFPLGFGQRLVFVVTHNYGTIKACCRIKSGFFWYLHADNEYMAKNLPPEAYQAMKRITPNEDNWRVLTPLTPLPQQATTTTTRPKPVTVDENKLTALAEKYATKFRPKSTAEMVKEELEA